MTFLSKIFKSKAKNWIYKKLEDSQTPSGEASKIITPREYYIEIWLRSLRIVNVRKGFNKFYPVVHSFISIPRQGNSQPSEFNMVTRPTKLEELNSKNIDKVITLNKLMLDKTPYKGGNIDLDIGLYSIKSEDLAGPYLSLLENISNKAGVGFISQALQFAEPIKTGISLLTGGNDDSIFEIGLSTTYEGSLLQTGYYVVIRAEEGNLDPSKLKIDATDFKLEYNGKKVEDYPYLVFEIKTSTQKPDWWASESLNVAYNQLTDACREYDINKIEDMWKHFKREVIICPDLISKDRTNIINIVEEELIKPVQGELAVSIKSLIIIKPLKEMDIYNI